MSDDLVSRDSSGVSFKSGHGHLAEILKHFLPSQTCVLSIAPLGAGNINDTYLAEFGEGQVAVLQRINGEVFPEPDQVAVNVGLVTRHLADRIAKSDRQGLHFPRVLKTLDGRDFYRDKQDHVWRLLSYVPHSCSYRSVQGEQMALEGGRILGTFHRLLDDFDNSALRNPLPGFHDLPLYCRHYRLALDNYRRPGSSLLDQCCRYAAGRLADADLLEQRRRSGLISERIIHGDPKCDNVLFDRQTGHALALIDLDTVSRGLLLHDLGDCLRSFCNRAGEQPHSEAQVEFDVGLCEQLLAGYRSSGAVLTREDQRLLYQAVRLLSFELGLRFLTDYLEGNRYFKVADDEENLVRAFHQFKLVESIEAHRRDIESVVKSVLGAAGQFLS